MQKSQSNENKNLMPELSLDKAEQILQNIYHAVGITPPDNCREILYKAAKKDTNGME